MITDANGGAEQMTSGDIEGFAVSPQALSKASKGRVQDMIDHHARMKSKLYDVVEKLDQCILYGTDSSFRGELNLGIGLICDSQGNLVSSLRAFQEKLDAAVHTYMNMESEAEAGMQNIFRELGEG